MHVRRRIRTLALSALVVLGAMLIAAGCGGDDGGSSDGALGEYDLSGAEFTVGSKDFTEQLVLGQITKLALEAAGADVNDEIGLAGTVAAREALTSGEIDMYWEYTGTGWITHLGNTDPIVGEQEQYDAVAEADEEQNDIVWFDYAPFNNTYALAVRSEAFDDLGVEKISDLKQLIADRPDEATICVESEFSTRDDGLPGLEKKYGFKFPKKNISLLDTGVVYTETDKGKLCNFGEVFATDGRIAALDLKLVEDDQSFFPLYNPALNVRAEVAEEHPELADMFAEIAEALDNETMTDLNRKVDVDGEFPAQVAKEWLESEDLI